MQDEDEDDSPRDGKTVGYTKAEKKKLGLWSVKAGDRFGRLVVIEIYRDDAGNQPIASVRCDCGVRRLFTGRDRLGPASRCGTYCRITIEEEEARIAARKGRIRRGY